LDNRIQLGQRLQKLIARTDKSYKDIVENFAQRSEPIPYQNQSSFSRILNGKRKPARLDLLKLLAWGLEIDNAEEINRVLKAASYEALNQREIEHFFKTIPKQEILKNRASMQSAFDIKHASGALPVIGKVGRNDVLPPPHQLTPPPRDFAGRLEEIEEILTAINQRGVSCVSLHGLPGIGKTALALKIAEKLAANYPDAQCSLDLKGVSATPLAPNDVMRYVIWSFKPDVSLPNTTSELAGLYQSVLHGKQALLLLDNARDATQIGPLIPPSTCMLLVTSRWHFILPGGMQKDVAVFSLEDSMALLTQITELHGAEAKAIAELCSGLPLALRAAGSVLAERIDLKPRDYASALIDARTRLSLTEPTENLTIEASFSLSYDLLAPRHQERFRMLAVFPGTFDLAAATAVWAIAMADAQETMKDLMKFSLVQFSPSNSRYSLHDLMRLFAEVRLKIDEREQAQERHAKHFEQVLAHAESLHLKGEELARLGLDIFHNEWPNIQSGQAWSAQHASKKAAAAQLCIRYPEAGFYLLDLRQHPEERIRWFDAALRAARGTRDRRAEARHLRHMGVAYWRLGEARRAITFFKRSVTIASRNRDKATHARALTGLGLAFNDLGKPRQAITYHKLALKFDRVTGDQRAQGRDLNNLGLAYAELGDTQQAVKYHKKQLTVARKAGDRRGESAALGNLAMVYRKTGNTFRAINYHEKALFVDREIKDRIGEAGDYYGLGLAFTDLGKLNQALSHYEQALAIAQEIGNHRREAEVLFAMSNVIATFGNLREAISRATEALKIFERIHHPQIKEIRSQIFRWQKTIAKEKND
jgi:tetratricopeptide (TPR) repeat protein